MKRNILHIIISGVLTAGFLLPICISFSHALHHHDNTVCKTKFESHIHSEKFECSNFHYISNTSYSEFFYQIILFDSPYSEEKTNILINNSCASHSASFYKRGPPVINV